MQSRDVALMDEVVRRALSSFAAEALDGSWSGRREREAVSLFVLGYLLREVDAAGFLRDPAQIGIEFPVPQIADAASRAISGRSGRKRQVCKDIVIWPEPRMTCWDVEGCATVAPAAILEWKFGVPAVDPDDVAWLKTFSAGRPAFLGYAIAANQSGRQFTLSCTRVKSGRTKQRWLHLR